MNSLWVKPRTIKKLKTCSLALSRNFFILNRINPNGPLLAIGSSHNLVYCVCSLVSAFINYFLLGLLWKKIVFLGKESVRLIIPLKHSLKSFWREIRTWTVCEWSQRLSKNWKHAHLLWVVIHLFILNRINPKSDEHLISLYSITPESNIEVMSASQEMYKNSKEVWYGSCWDVKG